MIENSLSGRAFGRDGWPAVCVQAVARRALRSRDVLARFDAVALLTMADQRRSPVRLSETVAERLADTMFALSTPSRVQILGCLLGGPHTVTELMAALGMEQSAVSHQLRVLREHTLVRVERQGRTRVYALHDEHVVALLEEAVRHVEQRKRRGRGGRVRRALGGAAEAGES